MTLTIVLLPSYIEHFCSSRSRITRVPAHTAEPLPETHANVEYYLTSPVSGKLSSAQSGRDCFFVFLLCPFVLFIVSSLSVRLLLIF